MSAGINREPRVCPARRGPGSRLVFPLLTLVMAVGHAGRAASQPAAQPAAPLPAVVYPSRDPDTGPPDIRPPAAPPRPAQVTEQGEPVQYYLVNGVWGYWDRNHQFRPMPAAGALRPPEHARPVPKIATVLPNPAPRRIVVEHFTPPNRNKPH